MDSTQYDVRRGATSASNAEADRRCQGRHLAIRTMPKTEAPSQGKSFWVTGQKIHAALASSPDGFKAKELIDALTVEERDVFDACRKIEKAEANRFFKKEDGPVRVYRERPDGSTRLWAKIPDGSGGFFQHSGQPDVVYRAGVKALIVEYKTLTGDVPESPENYQLRDQAVLLKGNAVVLKEIAVLVCQPLVTHNPVPCVYNEAALAKAEQEMFARVRASNNPNSPRTPGDIQCKFCPAKSFCAEHNRWAGSMVPAMLNVLDVPAASWSPEQRAIFCDNRAIAQKWLDDCETEIRAVLEKDPDSVPGWQLKPGNIMEKIINPQKVWDRFQQLGGKIDQFMGCISVGKSKLKEVVSKVTGAKGKSLDEAMKTITHEAVQTSQNRPSLARKE